MIMSDRICLMRDGHVEQIGTPDELYFHPRTRFAAEFLGESNVLTCEVVGVEASHVVVTAAGIRLRAPQDERLRDARRVALMVRPERVAILDAHAAGQGAELENRLEGCLRQVIRVSGLTRYYVGLDSGQTIVASTLTGDAKTVATPGSRVALTWPPDAGILLPPASTG
jgi:putative spermidine/putrescine transport system ATP-binding protein